MASDTNLHFHITGLKEASSNGEFHLISPLDLVIETMAKSIGFTYSLKWPPDGELYGKGSENGSWSGMVGMTQRGEVDVLVALMFMTPIRTKALDFSKYVEVTSTSILTGQKRAKNSVDDVLKNFSKFSIQVWLGVLTSAILVSLIFGFAKNLNTTFRWVIFRYKVYLTAAKHLLLMLGVLLQAGPNVQASSRSCKLAFGFFAMGTTFIVIALGSQFSTDLVSSVRPKFIENMEDLAKSQIVQPLTLGGSLLANLMEKSKSGIYAELYKKIQNGKGRLASLEELDSSPAIHTQVAFGRLGYIQGIDLLIAFGNDVCKQHPEETILHVGSERFLSIPTGFGFRKNLKQDLKRQFNDGLSRLEESGIFRFWFSQITKDIRCFGTGSSSTDNGPTEAEAFKLESMKWLIIVTCLGYSFATVIFFGEIIWSKIALRVGSKKLTGRSTFPK